MLLTVVIESNQYTIDIPDSVLTEAESFFNTMDQNMSKGWQMDRVWVTEPSTLQRCQIAASKLADAIATGNETMAHLASGYILTKMPDVTMIQINTEGEMQETRFM